jgi:hypothetical protein
MGRYEVVVEAARWTTDSKNAVFAAAIADCIRYGAWDCHWEAATAALSEEGTRMEDRAILILVNIVEVTGESDGRGASVV